MIRLLLTGALLLTAVTRVEAQVEVLDSVRGKDALVRLATDSSTFSGRVARLTTDSVWLKVSGRALAVGTIQQIEGRSYQRDLLGDGALLGAGIAGIAGWLISGVCLDCPAAMFDLWLGWLTLGAITGLLVDLAHEQFVWTVLWQRRSW